MKKVFALSLIIILAFGMEGMAQKKSQTNQKFDRPSFQAKSLQTVTESPLKNYIDLANKINSSHKNLKSAKASYLLKMDSIVYYNIDTLTGSNLVSDRHWTEYDSIGRTILDAELGGESYISFPDWGSKAEYTYDANGRISSVLQYDWSDQTGFYLSARATYQYDATGYLSRSISEDWDETGQNWIQAAVDSMEYDAGGTLLQSLGYYYDTITLSWLGTYNTIYEFDSSGNVAISYDKYFDVDSGYFVNNARREYYQDANGRDTSVIFLYWDFGYWTQSGKYTTKYNAAGAITESASYNWDGESIWYGSQKSEYILDANNNVQDQINYWYDFFNLKWYIYDKTSLVRDGTQNLITETSSRYDTASVMYTDDWQDFYHYDLGVLMSDIALPPSIESDINDNYSTIINKVDRVDHLYFDMQNLVWDSTEFENVYYSDFSGAVQPDECTADFTFREGQTPETIVFTSASVNALSWYWTFGDGTSSTKQTPTHVYKLAGTYTVTLSVTNAAGDCSNTMVRQVKVGNPPCNAEFSMLVDTAGLMITLENTSVGSNLVYSWNFGDGQVSRAVNPVHTYKYSGTYDINLTIQNDLGTCVDRYSLNTRVGTAICKADFDVFVDSAANSAMFTARNQNSANLFRWDFGDGGYATTPNVTRTFSKPGYYSARLIVSNASAGCVNSSKTEILVGRPGPGGKAKFISLSGNGNTVKFSDRSIGEDLSYYWDFNDGNFSKEANPLNEYVLPGYYNVCLTVRDASGKSNTYCEKIFAGEETTDECLAQFDYRLTENQLGISCFDRSLGNPDSWKWIYDDGWTTTVPNPVWSTGTPRYVKIQLTVRNSDNGCRDDVLGLVNMGAEEKLVAGFGYILDGTGKKADTYPVDFVGVSLGDAGKLKWDFGDGSYDSTSINPQHYYTQPGVYQVCLTVTNTTTGEEDTQCESVTVGPVSTFDDLNGLSLGVISYPNPSSGQTKIKIMLTRDSEIDLAVYDYMGRMLETIAHDSRSAGIHSFEFNAERFESGNYYLVLRTSHGVAKTVMSIVH